MKVSYKSLLRNFKSKPSIIEISNKLFQLGHEHELENSIFDIEITPNRGDCLSLQGLCRDLGVFFDIDHKKNIYQGNLDILNLDFKNDFIEGCPNISFLKIKIDEHISDYKGDLKNYFLDLPNKKNNFFTDISNYISFETGQPTHCYDASKMDGRLTLKLLEGSHQFDTLLGDKINLIDKNMVFLLDDNIINLAGVMGGQNTSCTKKTREVIVECAYFNPEKLIGTSIKYDIQSDAAYKFERGVDPKCHENVLRRFIKIVSEHADIKSLALFSEGKEIKNKIIDLDIEIINKIIGVKFKMDQYKNYFKKLGFSIENNSIHIPSHRSDINTLNDLAEEIARVVGYDNINLQELKIPRKKKLTNNQIEKKIKAFLVDNGFYEVINFPFTKNKSKIKLDNPLDSNKKYFRDQLKESLINNLLFNERRQKDSIKLFEVSEIYSSLEETKSEKVLGVIASGRVGKNYLDFSKKINKKYIKEIFSPLTEKEFYFEEIARDSLDTKLRDPIIYFEIKLKDLPSNIIEYNSVSDSPKDFIQYKQISDFPSSKRDLSFSIKDFSKLDQLQELIFSIKNELLKDVFIFDYYKDTKNNIIKIGFRFTLQSEKETITDIQVDNVMNNIIELALSLESVDIPGLKNEK